MLSLVKKSRAFNGTPRLSYRLSLAMWDHTVLPATRHKWTHRGLTPSRGLYSIYQPWRDGRLRWCRWPVTYQDDLPSFWIRSAWFGSLL